MQCLLNELLVLCFMLFIYLVVKYEYSSFFEYYKRYYKLAWRHICCFDWIVVVVVVDFPLALSKDNYVNWLKRSKHYCCLAHMGPLWPHGTLCMAFVMHEIGGHMQTA